ncbi:SCO family protein [Fredinandcohnia sp. QZ13]|uniref:SCO family protein n=1 Tax=Fredinandcohnia sp. QZ13 TaxID=3073144 RepID=UPI002853116A|nr:SCO family protein [Fredinandcohnia sp. QZ13]MDR4888594.1 SCO family protein [Fredinandcohnia sp. QZ13]
MNVGENVKKIKFLIVIALIFVLAACGSGIPNALNYEVSDFTYVDQNGEDFSLKDLEGKVWIADMIFTQCETVCPPMTAHMAKLQSMVKEEGLDVEFVSFSVDPEVDTPEMLKEYAEGYSDDLSNWHLLTGYSIDEITVFAKDSFKALVAKPEGQDQVLHVIKFYLVDQNGTVLKEYDGVSDTPYDEIIKDINTIL